MCVRGLGRLVQGWRMCSGCVGPSVSAGTQAAESCPWQHQRPGYVVWCSQVIALGRMSRHVTWHPGGALAQVVSAWLCTQSVGGL
jgi:hypothetical protein